MTKSCDILVVGGGVQGLWIARCALAAGLSVIVAERETCGAGASGGILGALMPHMPTAWSAKKQFQFEALRELEGLVRDLEAETGLDTGYLRCGRIIPIRQQKFLAEASRRVTASADAWPGFGQAIKPTSAQTDWISADAAEHGLLFDDLSARVMPRQYLAALRAAVSSKAEIREHWPFHTFDADRRVARSASGEEIAADHVVLAAGHETFAILDDLPGGEQEGTSPPPLGHGVKGQSALMRCVGFEKRPILFEGGVYAVPHAGGMIAVGSTSETSWTDAHLTDGRLDDVVARAQALCAPLRDAEVVERWAGIRPRCAARDPMVGRLPGGANLWVATGGFKITFGIAHRLARWLVGEITGASETISLPGTFAVAHHLAARRG